MVIPKAKEIQKQIIHTIESEGKKVSPFGIKTTRLLEYLEMSESDIREYVKDENLIFAFSSQTAMLQESSG